LVQIGAHDEFEEWFKGFYKNTFEYFQQRKEEGQREWRKGRE